MTPQHETSESQSRPRRYFHAAAARVRELWQSLTSQGGSSRPGGPSKERTPITEPKTADDLARAENEGMVAPRPSTQGGWSDQTEQSEESG